MWLEGCFEELVSSQTASVHEKVLVEVSSGLLVVGVSAGLSWRTFGCRNVT